MGSRRGDRRRRGGVRRFAGSSGTGVASGKPLRVKGSAGLSRPGTYSTSKQNSSISSSQRARKRFPEDEERRCQAGSAETRARRAPPRAARGHRRVGLLGSRQLAALVRHGMVVAACVSKAEMVTSLAFVVTTERRPESKVRRTAPSSGTASAFQSSTIRRGPSVRWPAGHTAV